MTKAHSFDTKLKEVLSAMTDKLGDSILESMFRMPLVQPIRTLEKADV